MFSLTLSQLSYFGKMTRTVNEGHVTHTGLKKRLSVLGLEKRKRCIQTSLFALVAISFGIILKETLKQFRTRKMRNEQILLPGPGINRSSFEPSVFEPGTFRSSVSRSPN